MGDIIVNMAEGERMAGAEKRAGFNGNENYGRLKMDGILSEIEIPVRRVKTFANKFVKIIPV